METAERFAAILAARGVQLGLLGPREVPRLWDRHILNCAVVAELIPPGCELVDIGSGAGLPGIVLAMLLPDVNIVLLEPMLRRVSFLTESARDLKLGNVTVCRARAEDMAGWLAADVVTARAVAPLRVLAEWATGVVRPGGTVLAIKGRSADAELLEARPVLQRVGARSVEVLRVGHGRVEPATTVIRFRSGASSRTSGASSREEQRGAHGKGSGLA
jgi:16S rRNA (guanine527-N7)-methyltransferase